MAGLCLTRTLNQSVEIYWPLSQEGGMAKVTLIETREGKARLRFEAPPSVKIWRSEVVAMYREELAERYHMTLEEACQQEMESSTVKSLPGRTSKNQA
jgi:sRNA-binding carbon storage regulator CsrA